MKVIEVVKVPPLIRLILRKHPYADDIMEQMQILIDEHTIEAEPVKHGRWIRPEGYCWRPECSECGYYGSAIDEPVIPFNYCPNCGAKMDLEG